MHVTKVMQNKIRTAEAQRTWRPPGETSAAGDGALRDAALHSAQRSVRGRGMGGADGGEAGPGMDAAAARAAEKSRNVGVKDSRPLF